MAERGFILHPTYRIENGRPVVHLFGRLESGASFLARDTRQIPHFFIRATDAAAARALGAAAQATTDLVTMRGEPVVRVDLTVPQDAPPLRDSLRDRGIPAYEADVRFAMRFLIDRDLRGALAIASGAAAPDPARGVERAFTDPDLIPADWSPGPGALRILSLDLETDVRTDQVLSAAITSPSGLLADEVLVALPEDEMVRRMRGAAAGTRLVACGGEKGLLVALAARLRETDFDILTGWNVIDFDLAVLVAAARRHGVPFEIGRLPGAAKLIRDTSFWGRSRADVAGRVVLDGIDLLKSAFVRLDDYRLDTAARAIVGKGKVEVEGPGGPSSGIEKALAIGRAFRDDFPLFVEYNIADARLALAVIEKAQLIDLAIRRSLLTGMPLDRVGASIASFDFLYLRELRRRGRVAPSVGAEGTGVEPTAGGAVLDPQPGLYSNVLAFDFKSLYPSLIRTFNLDPLGYVPQPDEAEGPSLIRAPNGAFFRREPGILPGMIASLFPQRADAKRRGDEIASHAIKILMNSFYGVLATPACRFYSSPVANAITHFGQWALHWARARFEEWGHTVLYGDTDSLFVLASAASGAGAPPPADLGASLARRLNDDLRREIADLFQVESHLELQFDNLFLKFFLPPVRGGTSGARKRYAGLVRKEGGGTEIAYVGLEVVRRDWTELAKAYQRGLIERMFEDAPRDAIAGWTREFVGALRAGKHDARLVYRKALRKEVEEYTATTPPHVKAARMSGTTGGLIEYVMTAAGPEPATARKGPLDYEHYVEKQIRPIAEQVFPHLGLSFDEALGRGQMRLF